MALEQLPKALKRAIEPGRLTPQERAKLVRRAYQDNPDLKQTYGSVRDFLVGHNIPIIDAPKPSVF